MSAGFYVEIQYEVRFRNDISEKLRQPYWNVESVALLVNKKIIIITITYDKSGNSFEVSKLKITKKII